MARIRTIKPEFFEDEVLSRLSAHDRLMFIGTWMLADKNGVLEYRPDWIKAKVFPYEHGEATDASQVLPRLVLGGFLVHYEVEGRGYLQVRNFSRHQRINGKEAQTETRYPTPDNELAKEKHPGSTREAPGATPESQEGKGREGKGKDIISARKKRDRSPDQACVDRHSFRLKGSKIEKKAAILEVIRQIGIDSTDQAMSEITGIWASELIGILANRKIPDDGPSPEAIAAVMELEGKIKRGENIT